MKKLEFTELKNKKEQSAFLERLFQEK